MLNRRFWSRPLAAGASLVMLLGVAACSAHPGTAVQVDDTRYSVDQVNEATTELSAIEGQPVPPSTVAYILAMDDSMNELAAENDIKLTDTDIRDLVAGHAKQAGITLSDLSVKVLRVSNQHNTLTQKIGPEKVQQQLQKKQAARDIELNPRYGVIAEDGTFAPPTLTGVLDGRAPVLPAK